MYVYSPLRLNCLFHYILEVNCFLKERFLLEVGYDYSGFLWMGSFINDVLLLSRVERVLRLCENPIQMDIFSMKFFCDNGGKDSRRI